MKDHALDPAYVITYSQYGKTFLNLGSVQRLRELHHRLSKYKLEEYRILEVIKVTADPQGRITQRRVPLESLVSELGIKPQESQELKEKNQ
jgi:hypothetical protein